MCFQLLKQKRFSQFLESIERNLLFLSNLQTTVTTTITVTTTTITITTTTTNLLYLFIHQIL
jgi:hypothetical protein